MLTFASAGEVWVRTGVGDSGSVGVAKHPQERETKGDVTKCAVDTGRSSCLFQRVRNAGVGAGVGGWEVGVGGGLLSSSIHNGGGVGALFSVQQYSYTGMMHNAHFTGTRHRRIPGGAKKQYCDITS